MLETVVEAVGQVLLGVLGVAAAVTLAAAAVLVLVVRRLRRSRRLRRLRLAARSAFGPAARPARLRLELDRSAEATQTALRTAAAAGRHVGELPALVAQLTAQAQALDRRLEEVEHEPDPELRRTLTARLGRDVAAHGRLAAEVRATLRPDEPVHLEEARAALAVEREVLRAWESAYHGAERRAGA